ncbi:MAG TPA: hypothetical protein VJV79_27575 [Polyangiaceae bacterium]|nr:hypothetical protein [Polyangiaceae bacterium]
MKSDAYQHWIGVCLALTGAACGDAEQSKPTAPACVTQTGTSSNSLIDDFEDGDNQLPRATNRHGSWTTINDGTGIQAPPPDRDGLTPFLMSMPGSPRSPAYALRSVGWGFTDWGASVVVGLNTTPSGPCSYDASVFSGIRFQAKGNGSFRVNLGTQETTPVADGGLCASSNCSDYGLPVDLPIDWTEVTVSFADLTQPGWASTAPWNAEAIVRLTLWVQRGDFEFWIDDLEFY